MPGKSSRRFGAAGSTILLTAPHPVGVTCPARGCERSGRRHCGLQAGRNPVASLSRCDRKSTADRSAASGPRHCRLQGHRQGVRNFPDLHRQAEPAVPWPYLETLVAADFRLGASTASCALLSTSTARDGARCRPRIAGRGRSRYFELEPRERRAQGDGAGRGNSFARFAATSDPNRSYSSAICIPSARKRRSPPAMSCFVPCPRRNSRLCRDRRRNLKRSTSAGEGDYFCRVFCGATALLEARAGLEPA